VDSFKVEINRFWNSATPVSDFFFTTGFVCVVTSIVACVAAGAGLGRINIRWCCNKIYYNSFRNSIVWLSSYGRWIYWLSL
jgi:hypothetical protein